MGIEQKGVIKETDQKILDTSIVDIAVNIDEDDSNYWTIEMHVYDLSDNKILSVHRIQNDTWELYNMQQENLKQEIPNNEAVQQGSTT